jgi:glutathionylspermidine synthase
VDVIKDTSAKPRNFREFLETFRPDRKDQGYNDVIHLFRMCLRFADGIIVNADALWNDRSIIGVTFDAKRMSFILRNGIVIRFELGADGKAHPVVGMLPQLPKEG